MFMLTDFVEMVVVAGLVTTLFFGGWQVPFLCATASTSRAGRSSALPSLVVVAAAGRARSR